MESTVALALRHVHPHAQQVNSAQDLARHALIARLGRSPRVSVQRIVGNVNRVPRDHLVTLALQFVHYVRREATVPRQAHLNVLRAWQALTIQVLAAAQLLPVLPVQQTRIA